MPSVCSQKMTACFTSASVTNDLQGHALLNGSEEREITIPHTSDETCYWWRRHNWAYMYYLPYRRTNMTNIIGTFRKLRRSSRNSGIVDGWKTNLMSIAILFHLLCAQHISDINISIFRSLRPTATKAPTHNELRIRWRMW